MFCTPIQNINRGYTKKYACALNFKKNNITLSSPKHSFNITFGAYPVYLFDGDKHASDIKLFAKAHDSEMDVHLIDVETNPTEPSLKQMDSALSKLKEVRKLPKGSHVAFLCAMFVPILNINDRMDHVNDGYSKHITAKHAKDSKQDVLRMLKKLQEYPMAYSEDIKSIDPLGQGIEYVYDIIQEINKLTDEGYRIYIPASHSNYQSVKYLKEKRNINSEFYHYVSTGKDQSGLVSNMLQYIEDNNWGDINLLEFSNAHIVNMTKKDGAHFLYSSSSDCQTEKANGVYNFTPIRKGGDIIGFSYSDDKTPEVKVNDFTDYDLVKELSPFVGKNISEVLATREETEKFKKGTLANNIKKLFPIEDIFSSYEIESKQYRLLGAYTDGKNIYDVNKNNKVVYQKLNCEGSERPSMYAMWGNCYAVIDAIKNDAEQLGLRAKNTKREIKTAQRNKSQPHKIRIGASEQTLSIPNILKKLYDADKKENKKQFAEAGEIYKDTAIKILKNNIYSVCEIKKAHDEKIKYEELLSEYKKNDAEYQKLDILSKFFTKKPTRPAKSFDDETAKQWAIINDCANILTHAGDLYIKSGQYMPNGRMCHTMAKRLLNGSSQSDELLFLIKKNKNLEDAL